jgi:hypothetical protein
MAGPTQGEPFLPWNFRRISDSLPCMHPNCLGKAANPRWEGLRPGVDLQEDVDRWRRVSVCVDRTVSAYNTDLVAAIRPIPQFPVDTSHWQRKGPDFPAALTLCPRIGIVEMCGGRYV